MIPQQQQAPQLRCLFGTTKDETYLYAFYMHQRLLILRGYGGAEGCDQNR